MREFLESIKSRDPAAKSLLSVILTYPGVKAVFFTKYQIFSILLVLTLSQELFLKH